MAQNGSPGTLVVRRFERQSLCMLAEVRPADSMKSALRLSRTAGHGTGAAPATLFDLSEGGMGIRSGVFFPKRSELIARVLDDSGGVVAEVPCIVQRVTMVGRKPEYELGLSFNASAQALAPMMKALLHAADGVCAEKGGGARA